MGKKAQRRRAQKPVSTGPHQGGPTAESIAEFFDVPLDHSLVGVELTPSLRLARIAKAHTPQDNQFLGRQDCVECEQPWPCPTYVVATAETIDDDPFAVRDRQLYRDIGMR